MPRLNSLLLIAMLLTSAVASAAEVIELSDYKTYPIEPRSGYEPSGLTIKNGQLFTVSDKHSAIYRIEIKGDVAHLKPQIKFNPMQLGAINLDLEGITVVDADFFLVSEAHHKLLKVNPDGQISWVPEFGSVFKSAEQAGLFQVFNAALEGITYLGNHQFLLAAERQPRGLIELQLDQDFKKIIEQKNFVLKASIFPPPTGRNTDLAGLYKHRDTIYGLYRNAEIIHQWNKDQSGQYREGKAWSFAHIVGQAQHRYQDNRFGHAEGLAVDDDYFYVILDNNQSPKATQSNDRRPLLLIIRRP